MIPNHSPWIHQLNRTRAVEPLQQSLQSDIVIVGGGIAGVVTAYFLLQDTDKEVILLEADKVAHGATGHNAGQIASYFERSLSSIVTEFGLQLAVEGQGAVESGWLLIDEIVRNAGLKTPLYRFTGYAGCSTKEQLIEHLNNNKFRLQGGLPTETIFVAKESGIAHELPDEYIDLYSVIPHQDLLSLLETKNTDYIALLAYQKGCMNSALFTEELAGYLLATYADRFSLYEGSPVTKVSLQKDQAVLTVLGHTIRANRVVLCTNGFENFTISNEDGHDIDTTFHHELHGRIGYMAGYVEPLNHPPVAISYFPKELVNNDDPTGPPYFYFTRRPQEQEVGKEPHSLVCGGGPEKVLPNQAIYSREDATSESNHAIIDEFLRTHYQNYPEHGAMHAFSWHGLMGYTPSGIRRIGPEPCNEVLLYNLGCNGVGILPSVYGGKRISEWVQGLKLLPSIFDPVNQLHKKNL